jgi:hypothetical protein
MDFQKHVVVIMATAVVVVVVVVVVVELLLLVLICFITPSKSLRFRTHIKQDLLALRIFNAYLLLWPVSTLNLPNIAVKWVAVLIRIRFMIRVHIWTDRLLVLIPKNNGLSPDKYKCRANTQIKPRPIPSTTSSTNY